MIHTDDKDEIFQTIRVLNESYLNYMDNFKELFGLYYHMPVKSSILHYPVMATSLFNNFVSAMIMNDNLYAFTFNQTLLSMDL